MEDDNNTASKLIEIKEILKYLKNNTFIPDETKRKYKILHRDEVNKLLDYITNLQEELEVARNNEDTFRLEMQDITKALALDEHTLFDDVKDYATNLQKELETRQYDINNLTYQLAKEKEENAELKEKIKYASDKLVGYVNAPYVITNEYFEDIIRTIEENTDIQIGTNCMDFMEELEDYKSRIEKAVEYIKKDTRWFDSEYAKVYGELCTCAGANANRLEVLVNPSNLLNILNGKE